MINKFKFYRVPAMHYLTTNEDGDSFEQMKPAKVKSNWIGEYNEDTDTYLIKTADNLLNPINEDTLPEYTKGWSVK